MKITKSQLRRIIKEELENALKETAVPNVDQKQLKQLLASISACITAENPFKILECTPHVAEVGQAFLNQNYLGAMVAAQKLQACVPDKCAESMKQVLAIIAPLVPKT